MRETRLGGPLPVQAGETAGVEDECSHVVHRQGVGPGGVHTCDDDRFAPVVHDDLGELVGVGLKGELSMGQ
jgi:hypothetical protein